MRGRVGEGGFGGGRLPPTTAGEREHGEGG
jgi:hypothetical protein